jgi:hypothetical protein
LRNVSIIVKCAKISFPELFGESKSVIRDQEVAGSNPVTPMPVYRNRAVAHLKSRAVESTKTGRKSAAASGVRSALFGVERRHFVLSAWAYV